MLAAVVTVFATVERWKYTMSRLLGAFCLIVALCVGLGTTGCGKKKNTSTTSTSGMTHKGTTTKREEATTKREEPTTKREEPTTKREETTTKKEEPTTKKTETTTKKTGNGTTTKKEETKKAPAGGTSYLEPARRDSLLSSLTALPRTDFLNLPTRLETARREERRG
jgi:uncharacterized protein HemX